MFSARRLTLIILVLALTLTAAACGDDDKDKDEDKNGNKSEQTTSLSETLVATNGVTVKYPKGWISKEEDGNIQIVNSQEALDATNITTGQAGLMVMDPAMMSFIATPDVEKSPNGLLTAYSASIASEGADMTFGDVTDTTVNGKKAARLSIGDDKTEGLIVVVELDESTFVLTMGVAAKGELSKFESTLLDITGSITYAAPAPVEATEESAG